MKTWLSGDVSKRLALGGDAETAHELELEIEQVRARLAANEAERKELEAALRDLVSRRSATVANYSSPAIADAPRVIAASPAAEKIALFRDRAVRERLNRPRRGCRFFSVRTGLSGPEAQELSARRGCHCMDSAP